MEVDFDGGDWSLGWTDDSTPTNFCNYLWSFRVMGIYKERIKI
jgi:hypothetical protein